LKLATLHRLSLRRTLLLVLLPGLLAVVGAELALTWRTALDAANAAYDRSLLGAIKSIDANISTASGGLGVELPYRMLEFFELTANGQVYYRVATEDGLVEIGSADLPPPPRSLVTGQPQFSDARYFDEAVRVGSYARLLDRPLAGRQEAQRIVIQVAETLQSRREFTRSLVLQAVARDLLLVLAAALLLVAGVAWALRPLARLRHEVRARAPQDMAPITTTAIPADVRPLVQAINYHIERNHRMAEARRRFIDDASHQLRTPLTTLATQVGFALRERDAAGMGDVLLAIKAQLDETVRQTNQMLALARADSGGLDLEALDVAALVEVLTREWWTAARDRGIDLGFEGTQAPLPVRAQPALLREALANLLHNAIRYTPRGGQVTVRVRRQAERVRITVSDTGPGIPAEEMARAGERFFRGSNVRQPGSGLGLAIVRSIAERHGGVLELAPGASGQGLEATIELPLVA
jgi:two-component system, OmpR family, sensor histidine kinase TctE